MTQNKTAAALELMRKNPGMTVYAAARKVGIAPTTLYAGKARAERLKAMTRCPCCDSPVTSFAVPESILAQLRAYRDKAGK